MPYLRREVGKGWLYLLEVGKGMPYLHGDGGRKGMALPREVENGKALPLHEVAKGWPYLVPTRRLTHTHPS